MPGSATTRAAWAVAGGVLVTATVSLLLGGTVPTRAGAAVDAPFLTQPQVTIQGQPIPHRPNIVVVMADDMRTDDLRFMPAVRHLLRRTGVDFANSFSPYPLCCPARASFLTGVYAHNHHVLSHLPPWGFQAFDDHRTLASALQRAGYRTGFVGKYLNEYGAEPSLVTGGPSLRYVPNGWDEWHALVELPAGSPIGYGGTYDYFNPVLNVNGHIVTRHGATTRPR